MELPRTVRVGGFDWTIEEQDDVAREGNIFGSTHILTQKIFIDPKCPPQKRSQAVLHELMHAIWWQSGLEKFLNDEVMKGIEEKTIHTLSMSLYQVLKDNPGII